MSQSTTGTRTETEMRNVSIKLPDHLYRRFKATCVMERIQIQSWMSDAIERFLSEIAEKGRAA